MKILITGATGFIGGRLVGELLKKGHSLTALVRAPDRALALKQRGIETVCADIRDRAAVDKLALPPVDAICHCAALVDNKNAAALHECNAYGTENLCRLALKQPDSRMVYLSSVAVVSGNHRVPLVEDLPYSATNLYGTSKIEAEKIVLSFRSRGLRAAIIRPSMVYGEGEPHLMGLILSLLKRRVLPIPHPGDNRLHLAYVGNVVNALLLALQTDVMLEGTYFIADQEALSVKEVATIFSRSIGAGEPPEIPAWLMPAVSRLPWAGKKISFFLKDRVYDITRILKAGYIEEFHAREALASTARHWLLTQKNRYR